MKKNNFRKQFVRLFTVLAIAGTFALTAVAQTKSDDSPISRRCSLRSLNGNYGAIITGTLVLSPTMSVPLNNVSIYTFDGAGHFTGSGTGSTNGEISSGGGSGTYTVANNCTGTLTVIFPNGFTITNNIVLVDEGSEVFLIQTTPGTVVSGVMKHQ